MNWRAIATTARVLPTVSWRLTVVLAFSAVAQTALGLAFMLAVGRFVGHLPALVRGEVDGWVVDLALIAASYLTRQLLSALVGIVQWRLGQRVNHQLDDRVMAVMLAPAGIGHLEDSRTRDLAAEAADGLGAGRWRPAETPGALFGLAAGGLGIVVSPAVVVWLQWWLGLLLAVASGAALYTIVRQFLRLILEVVDAEGEAVFRRVEYERDVAVAPASAKEVRLFGFAPWVLDRWQGGLLRVLDLNLRKLGSVDRAVIVTVPALVLVVAGGFVWAAVRAGQGELGLAAATVLVQALLNPITQFEVVAQACLDLAKSARPAQALRELEAELAARDGAPRRAAAGLPGPASSDGADATIRLTDVSFRYPGTERDVLRDVDLEIPTGSSLAVVGFNGAGKTTLVKLLCRFYEPTRGQIAIGGTDLREVDPAEWQRRVAAIFQDFARFPMSAEDNIGVGALASPRERIEAAAQRSGVATVLADLPDGWSTMLSREFVGGTDLSGGQWQRVALARAVLAAEAGAQLLILDEPAAKLDVRAEADLNERFLDLTGGVTTMVISHRFSTVRRADRICVLDGGRITELGSHAELLDAGGQYARMFRLQAERFD